MRRLLNPKVNIEHNDLFIKKNNIISTKGKLHHLGYTLLSRIEPCFEYAQLSECGGINPAVYDTSLLCDINFDINDRVRSIASIAT